MKNKGFTLIELLGVIVIISLLMLIVMPKIINSLKSTSIKVDDLTLKMIYSASELYVDEYPNKFEEINGNKNCITLRDLTGEGYLKSPINVDDIDITDLKSVQVTYNNGFKFEVVDKDDCVVETSGEYDDGTTGGGSSDDNTPDVDTTQKITLGKSSVLFELATDDLKDSIDINTTNVDINDVKIISNTCDSISGFNTPTINTNTKKLELSINKDKASNTDQNCQIKVGLSTEIFAVVNVTIVKEEIYEEPEYDYNWYFELRDDNSTYISPTLVNGSTTVNGSTSYFEMSSNDGDYATIEIVNADNVGGIYINYEDCTSNNISLDEESSNVWAIRNNNYEVGNYSCAVTFHAYNGDSFNYKILSISFTN